ncbi:hypothetical protein QJS04_geneDACA003838 [Acorus gramineus]|uniref:Uncharacterized protein n=1 Tax=Acorus gramineus TaxID=55184 RepID=A0AAV9BHM0_ACOGR|nr:hypothetical protein QJS04_geneDACA003838 [Acorus gramineus]
MYAVRKDSDQYGRLNNQFSLVQHRPSSERILKRAPVPERRRFHREESQDRIDQSDLRHRLTKKMKFNGLRSTVSPDRRGEYYRGDDRRDIIDWIWTGSSHNIDVDLTRDSREILCVDSPAIGWSTTGTN